MPRKDIKLSDLDLRGYISRYDSKSETRIQRLVFLARNEKCDSPKLAYSLLEEQLKKSRNVTRYTEIFGRGTPAAGDAMDVDTSVAKGMESMSIITLLFDVFPIAPSLVDHWCYLLANNIIPRELH